MTAPVGTGQVYEVPFVGSVPQTLSVQFPNGNTYQLSIQFQFLTNACWLMDIADDEGNPLLQGVPLVCGADLLGQYAYLGFGAVMYCTVDGDSAGVSVPSWGNLGPGLTSHLWLQAAEPPPAPAI
jgi:hypothetical protein